MNVILESNWSPVMQDPNGGRKKEEIHIFLQKFGTFLKVVTLALKAQLQQSQILTLQEVSQ